MAEKTTVALMRAHADSRRISGLIAVFFLVTSILAIYEVAQTRRAFSTTTDSSTSIRAVREFYAGLNRFIQSGDSTAVMEVLAPGALQVVPEHGAMGASSELLTYLLALRSTYPQLQYTIDRIDAGNDIAIASVRISGTDSVTAPVRPIRSGIAHEFFRVRNGRIVQHWTTEPALALQHPFAVGSLHTEVSEFRHLAMAELSFEPHERDPQSIDGPAFIIVQHGRLALVGDGTSQILDIATGSTSAPAWKESAFAVPGQAISILDRKAFVLNTGADTATALIATLVDDRRQAILEMPDTRRFPPPAINDITLMVSERSSTYGAVTVRPLEFEVRSIPVGNWEYSIGWVVLGPGASLPLPAAGVWVTAHVISGSASRDADAPSTSETPSTLTNDGDPPAVVLFMWLRATD